MAQHGSGWLCVALGGSGWLPVATLGSTLPLLLGSGLPWARLGDTVQHWASTGILRGYSPGYHMDTTGILLYRLLYGL